MQEVDNDSGQERMKKKKNQISNEIYQGRLCMAQTSTNKMCTVHTKTVPMQ